jgi:hypothetical protein
MGTACQVEKRTPDKQLQATNIVIWTLVRSRKRLEMVGRPIQKLSPRALREFVSLDCNAVAPALLAP